MIKIVDFKLGRITILHFDLTKTVYRYKPSDF